LLLLLFLFPAVACLAQKNDAERFPETKTRRLTDQDIKGWSEAKILYAINEIYARHGVDFADKAIKQWFVRFSWYAPEEGMSYEEAQLTDVEATNVEFLEAAGARLPTHYDEDIAPGRIAVSGAAAKTRVVNADLAGKGQYEGNVRIHFADGHSEVLTRDGHCLMPHVSTTGDAGWVYGGLVGPPPASRRVGKDVLFVRLADGTERKFETGAYAFIEEWHFVKHATAVVIKSRGNHGPSAIVAYNLKTGRVLGRVGGMVPWEQMPAWARYMAD
jgi:hypothetical protein